MRRIEKIRLTFAVLAFACLQGCMNAGPNAMPADKAFALSASALSGVESYGVEGEVSIVGASGNVVRATAFEGIVNDHDQVKMKWTNMAAPSDEKITTLSVAKQTYEPLGLLSSIRSHTAKIEYNLQAAEANEDQVSFSIRLDDNEAKRRIETLLRKELSDLEADKALLERSPKASANVLGQAKKTLENTLSGLKVTTDCVWTANRRTWFPARLQEDTVLTYEWQGKTVTERRESYTNFRKSSGSDTMK